MQQKPDKTKWVKGYLIERISPVIKSHAIALNHEQKQDNKIVKTKPIDGIFNLDSYTKKFFVR